MAHALSLDGYKRAVAGFFDTRDTYSRSELHARMAERLVRLAAPQPAERVLDIATGTGFVSTAIARQVGPAGSVVGVDISAGMLKQAARAISAEGLENLQLVQADAEALNFPDNSFDLITCCNALPYMADVPGTLRRWRSLLRPGGRLVFNCWAENSHATGHLLRTIAAAHGIQIPVVGNDTGSPERCRSILSAAGFIQPEVLMEPSAWYFSVDRLEDVLNSALKNPLFGIAQNDLQRVTQLREEYMAAAQSASARKSVEAEMGAYFISAYK